MSRATDALTLIELKVAPKSKTDWPKFEAIITSVANEDAHISCKLNGESHEVLIGGNSELHIDEIIHELKTKGLTLNIGNPQIAYRQTIMRKVTNDYTHKKFTSGLGQFARIVLRIEPNERGAGNTFESQASDKSLPKKFISAIQKEINSILSNGPLTGFPIIDMKTALIDGAYNNTDSSKIAFEIATHAAMREAIEKAKPILLEPIMKVAVTVLTESLSNVIDDLNSRRGKIIRASTIDNAQVITALVSLSSMIGYTSRLNSLSKGSANFTMEYSHYQPVKVLPEPENFPPAVGMRA